MPVSFKIHGTSISLQEAQREFNTFTTMNNNKGIGATIVKL
jgi:hypothetical protein